MPLPGLTLATQQPEVSSGTIPVTTASEEVRELFIASSCRGHRGWLGARNRSPLSFLAPDSFPA